MIRDSSQWLHITFGIGVLFEEEQCRRNPQQNLIYPDADDCRSYYHCQDGFPHRVTCLTGLYFNQALQACEVDNTHQCIPQRTIGNNDTQDLEIGITCIYLT